MAVSNNYEIKNYILDGIVTQFAIPFDVNVDDYGNAINIVVYLGVDELEKDVDYTISIKTINYPGAVDHAGEKLTVFRRTPIEQPVDFVDNGNFTLEDIEIGLDRSIMIEQETSANLGNTIRAQESAERAEQYKDIAIEKASDAEDWAVGTRSDGQTPAHSLESAKHYAEAADTSASMATSMRNQALTYRLVSEGYATGQQTEVDVDPTSPYYHNNSKYYKEQAALSAGAASGSATSAYNSELAAAASKDKAHDWADKATDSEVEPGEYSAKHWASKASISSGSAAVSAYNAGISETNAGTSETNAGLSATAADTSAKNSEAWAVGKRGGTDVPPTDPTYHNNAKYYCDQTAANSVTPDNVVTLTNKTIDAKDNTLVCTATSITTSQTLTPTKQMMVTIDDTVTLTLGSGSYIGQELPVLAQTTCDVSYTGQDGASVDNLNAGDYITYVWQGTYWIVDASTYIKPTYISTSQTVTPTKAMLLVIDTTSVVLTLGNGMYDGFELPVLAQADCSIVYEGVNGTVTETREDGDYNVFVWNDSYWVPKQTTPITGIDDNGQPFAFNIDSLIREKGIINLTGTDADGNPFDYGLGKLVLAADEDNIVTGQEIKTTKTYNGKPIYEKEITGNYASTVTWVSIAHGISDIAAILDIQGTAYNGSVWYPVNYTSGSSYSTCIADSTNISFLTNTNSLFGKSFAAKISYTKTTD